MASFSPKIPKINDHQVSPKMNTFGLTNMNLSELDAEKFEELGDLEILDLSKNQLKSLPELSLPNLKVLNCEDNAISDVQSLLQFSTLEHIYLAGNPLNIADRYFVVDQLANLESLDGKSVTEMRSALKKLDEKLDAQVVFLRKEKYDALLKVGLRKDEVSQVEKQFARELLRSLLTFSEIPLKIRRLKAQAVASDFFKDVVVSAEEQCASTTPSSSEDNPVVVLERLDASLEPKCNGNLRTDIASHVKYKDLAKTAAALPSDALIAKKSFRRPSHNKVCQPEKDQSKSVFQNVGFSPKETKVKKASENSRVCRKSEELGLDYDPHIFLRCHGLNQDNQDDSVSVWRAAFEPDLNNKGETTDVVATCGGSIVCFINCVTGHVLERYKDENPAECFYSLAWTISPISDDGHRACTLLATGGAGTKICLIYPALLKCYRSFKAHTEDINTLIFHHTQTTWLFSGGNDNCIHVWDIGFLSVPDFTTYVQKLMTFETKSNVLHLVISDTHDCLVAACSRSLMIWDFPDDNCSDALRDSSMDIGVDDLCHAESGGVIDGLVLVENDCIAVKVSLEPTIYLLKISALLKSKNRTKQISPEAVLIWSSCDSSYNYLGYCKDINVMACGDNVGQIWMYDLKKFFAPDPEVSSDDDVSSPTIVIPWPDLSFEHEPLAVKDKVVINSLAFNWNGMYMVACTDTNIVCIWKKA